jgi:hypothetical protein
VPELLECISNLVFGVDGEDLDEPLAHMLAKMMIANIYVLGPWAAPALSSKTLQ